MKAIAYYEIMLYLDIIESELNKIARATGHPTYNEFFNTSSLGVKWALNEGRTEC